MLYYLAVIAGLIALAALCVVAYAATRPDGFRVQRSVHIDAPPHIILPLINDFRAWGAWSPWEHKDPNMQRSYRGAPTGRGSTYAWEGNKEIGKGEITMTEASASKVVLDMNFLAPFKARNIAEFTLEPQGHGTNVTWAMHGPTPLMVKILHLFMNMDKMCGTEFEKGLEAMKQASEARRAA